MTRHRGNVPVHGIYLDALSAQRVRAALGLASYASADNFAYHVECLVADRDELHHEKCEGLFGEQALKSKEEAVTAARAEWEASEPTCSCCWVGRHETIGDAVPFLQPCAGHSVYGDWRVKQARAEWEADHEKNGGSTYFNEMVHLQRKCVALGTDVETYKRLALENGAARDHAIKEWHLSQDRNAELSGKLDKVIEELKSAQQEYVVQVGSRCWRAEVELEKARARLQEPGPGRFTCDRCGKVTPNSEGGDDSAPGACATCWALRECQVALSAISGALVDAGSVVVEPYADAVRALTAERDHALENMRRAHTRIEEATAEIAHLRRELDAAAR